MGIATSWATEKGSLPNSFNKIINDLGEVPLEGILIEVYKQAQE